MTPTRTKVGTTDTVATTANSRQNCAIWPAEIVRVEQRPVTQNLLRADTESQKEGNDDGDEEEWRHIFAGPECVFAVGKGKPHEPRQQHGKGWRFEEVDPEVLFVAPLGEDIS